MTTARGAPSVGLGGAGKQPQPLRWGLILDEASLYQHALWYIGRYAASTMAVRHVLRRRVGKYALSDGVNPDTALDWIEVIIDRLTRAGLVNDVDFGLAWARTLFARGLSIRMIRIRLAEKGLAREVVELVLERQLAEVEDADFEAAKRYVRRRRLGAQSTLQSGDGARRRALSALARAGFSYDVATRALDCPDKPEDTN